MNQPLLAVQRQHQNIMSNRFNINNKDALVSWCCGVFTVKFEQILHTVLKFPATFELVTAGR